MTRPRITPQVGAVLSVLASNPDRERYPLEICEATGLLSGTVYPIMTRLAAAGWIMDRWEEIDRRAEGRPARRYWRLVPEHVEPVRALLASRRALLLPVDQGIRTPDN